jgi:hypothetical protein
MSVLDGGGLLHAPTVSLLGKEPEITNYVGGWVGLQKRSGHCGGNKYLIALSGNRTRTLLKLMQRIFETDSCPIVTSSRQPRLDTQIYGTAFFIPTVWGKQNLVTF